MYKRQDQYQQSGDHEEIFGHFGDPRDYWVRSTRVRHNRVYPTKPIVGFVRRVTGLNGGWSTRESAAAGLHNSGFIIVAQDDEPVSPPERYDHLIRDADRIRLCALNYFIEPAREKGAFEVFIRVSDLAAAMRLQDAFPNICQALGGEKFQQLAQVPPPSHTEPNPSSSTIFTYKLASQAEATTVTEEATTPTRLTTNLVLYGPPGTGKTYLTAWEAVRLCFGEEVAAALHGYEKRDALMAEYRRLVSDGRIEFVTFHQSMSYEEFVEGLRPSMGEDEIGEPGDSETHAGFRLKCHDGVFKRISERARLDQGGNGRMPRLDRKQGLFKLSLIGSDWRDQLAAAKEHGHISWGFGAGIDWSAPEFEDFQAIKKAWLERNPEADGRSADISGTWYFRGAVDEGSYVILTVGKNRMVALGRILGDYEFRPGASANQHFRSVEWFWTNEQGADRSTFYPQKFSSFQPIYQLAQDKIDWDALETIVFGDDTSRANQSAREYVLIIDEINRANISKVFGELITLLEPDKRLGMSNEIRLILPYSKKPFSVPANLHIIGTMNTADRSIALLDTALRRRFTFRELMPNPLVLPTDVGGIDLRKLLTMMNDRIEYLFDREHQIGHAYFTGCATRGDVEEVMRHKVIPLLAEYFYEDWSKVAAVLGETGQGPARFLEVRRLTAPEGIAEDDFSGEKLRWRVKDQFDFSEFEV